MQLQAAWIVKLIEQPAVIVLVSNLQDELYNMPVADLVSHLPDET
jgi:hypothetical protein